MKVKTYYELDSNDIAKMPFNAFHESWVTDSQYFTQKRKRGEFFTEEELAKLPDYVKKASDIYRNGRTFLQMEFQEYKFWLKIGLFLDENWLKH